VSGSRCSSRRGRGPAVFVRGLHGHAALNPDSGPKWPIFPVECCATGGTRGMWSPPDGHSPRREVDETFGAPTSPVEPDLGAVEEVADLIGHAIHLGLHEPVGASLQGRRRRGAMGSRIFQLNWGEPLQRLPGLATPAPPWGCPCVLVGCLGTLPGTAGTRNFWGPIRWHRILADGFLASLCCCVSGR